ncbi:purine-binding chemotaxis protein CheW [Methanoculleus sp. Wushi-C6]|uniref:Purine-binding chemotaxis protein CheW n=1 Tax=Methanoculleus caldifontis TaxID=2651577 RepID=A0ABU3WY83_9EURY|nr:chemotaxis protein CheW [Methanoculleus sp. Wushi-C6]MDV2480760.1 purine-binding chemotaxis protein CheW [Methanoculleus sp. Wushi-C6]
MAATIDVVEFEIKNSLYALDIGVAREIVEMMPITPIPRAPPYLAGIINLRGELTNIIDLASLLDQVPAGGVSGNQKIIVLVPEAAGGSNIGIIVDEVHSVIKVPEEDTETMDESFSSAAYIKGIIKLSRGEGSGRQAEKDLVVWIDVPKILGDLVTRGRGPV